jgi:GNAT superfamily N-acetyltransferase
MSPSDPMFVEVDPSAPEARELISALDAELCKRYPNMPIHGIEPAEFQRSGGVFLIARVGGVPVACGAVRPLIDGSAEVKRMFVRPDQRGNGFGKAMLARLEDLARQRGYRTVRLETGDRQQEAIALYQSTGYHPIPRFGQYSDDPRSRCFEKPLFVAPEPSGHGERS